MPIAQSPPFCHAFLEKVQVQWSHWEFIMERVWWRRHRDTIPPAHESASSEQRQLVLSSFPQLLPPFAIRSPFQMSVRASASAACHAC